MFDQLPSNATARQGGSAEFNCTVLSVNSSTQVNSSWEINNNASGLGLLVHLGENDNVNKTNLTDGSTAFIGKPFNSLLTIANVTRSLDGTQVRCLFFKNGTQMFQEMPYAFLTVQCELFNVRIHSPLLMLLLTLPYLTYLPAP